MNVSSGPRGAPVAASPASPTSGEGAQAVSQGRAPLANTLGIILAAGMGKRMKTSLPKVAHTLLGKPLVLWAVDSMREAGVTAITVVLSPAQRQVEEMVRAHARATGAKLAIAWQEEAKGTGHAALCGLQGALRDDAGLAARLPGTDVLVGFGDTPAVTGATFARYLGHHVGNSDGVTVFAFEPESPTGYGRVLLDEDGDFLAIREEKDCTPTERAARLCNSGFLCARGDLLAALLPRLGNANAAGEYYLTDVPALARVAGEKVGVFRGEDARELAGVNSQEQLAALAAHVQGNIVRAWMDKGVQFLDPRAAYVEPGVTFESDVIVEPFVYLAGASHFANGTRVRAGSRVVDGRAG